MLPERAAMPGTVALYLVCNRGIALTAISALVTYKQVETGFIAVGAKALSFQACFPKMTLVSSGFWHGN